MEIGKCCIGRNRVGVLLFVVKTVNLLSSIHLVIVETPPCYWSVQEYMLFGIR